MEATKVLIVHPSRLLRDGLTFVLNHQDDLRVVRAVASTDEFLAGLEGVRPDAVLLDLGLPEKSGLCDARRMRAAVPGVRILVIGVAELESEIIACVEAGAAGYVPTDASLDTLLQSLRAIAADQTLCSPRVTRFLFSRLADQAERQERLRLRDLPNLTRREHEILALIEHGCSNKEIAVRLCIELQTVKNHVHNILEKLQLHSRREAARRAREWGLHLQAV
jgi:DNA-binding NarL/FixJ family response regulator